MSGYGAIRKQMHEQAAQPERNPAKCAADGCPGRATLSVEGGRWCCAAHTFAPSDRWPAISEKLRGNDWLIGFIDQIKAMNARHEDWRGFAVQFWAGQDEFCAPDPKEGFVPYENRMRGDLLYRCGLVKRPNVRRPKPVKPGGYRFAELQP